MTGEDRDRDGGSVGVPTTRRALLDALADGPVSGPALAERLGVSRAAVWNHVEALRDAGLVVESTDDGYVLADASGYSAEAIAFGLDAPFAVEYHDSVASTNDRARDLAAAGADDIAVVADEQTSGRGRLDREWCSPPGGIWLSLLVRPDVPPAHAPAYTLAMAVAVTQACREAGVDARIKWPNDVLVGGDAPDSAEDTERGGRKLCGILTEMEGEADRVSWLAIGTGLNANIRPDDLPPSADATSLLAERGEPVDRRLLVQRVLEEFDDLRDDLRGAVSAWEEHADTVGQRVRVETPSGVVEGEAIGIEFPGALLVDTGEETTRVTAGDCEHLRPVTR
ncbi:biotin--[acetyl-CoA-carboxylase] ligase [Halobaculum gomorrense]|uniref:BirA family transcriptional regulator, biotin operon repressor / biotin-[acetyl-CoA-carboxylase] ligase n=1 Tax=Halobaculum gomorrense TaxID=43928 RepID=A0A1M5SIA4_9EURY|nr:biotin--[acetyl-CoA-carboxylase] ligase [Halobaculum gomorrense]SHH37623.1 BirA family transcriptional regulator, biotin operon repressor / biotin-[acetyl-CoA-carboxylase] ligase [Halobaculum gomorrense]